MLLADSKGAQLLVAVGTHASLVEFLDKGRAGMASTFLTRLRVGPKLVDAKGCRGSTAARSRPGTWSCWCCPACSHWSPRCCSPTSDRRSAACIVAMGPATALYWIKELFT